jgi:pseudomonalisin
MRMQRAIQIGIFNLALLVAAGSAVAAPVVPVTPTAPAPARIILSSNMPPQARPELEVGRVSPTLQLDRVILSLAPRPGAEAKLEQFLRDVQDPSSPRFHQWLTPEQYGAQFGLSDGQLREVTGWLEKQGLKVDEVARGRGWVNFSGSVAQVEAAFATELHEYSVDGVVHHANSIEPSVPRELGRLVSGVVSLHNFRRAGQHTRPTPLDPARPQFTVGGGHSMGPADFATIYNLQPVYSASNFGGGQTIAITSRAEIDLPDIRIFRNTFGLEPNDPVEIHNGPPPAESFEDDFEEAMLDTTWSGAVAPKATIDVVISASTEVSDGIDLSAQFAVDQNVGSVVSTSFGQCEALMGSAAVTFFDRLWSQAAAEGMTVFVSSGDSGAAGCNRSSDTRGKGLGVNGICTSPSAVCVGGTQFADTVHPNLYWTVLNNFDNGGSALRYIPEIGWNESLLNKDGDGLFSSGGGASIVFAKPSFQKAKGVPADGRRDVPDLSLTAAIHDGYDVSLNGVLFAIGGTSASSPAMAGIMALLNDKMGSRQGNINPTLYALGAAQFAGTGPIVFHDVQSGNNSVPRQKGFVSGPGFDLVTGLGSVNAGALLSVWP